MELKISKPNSRTLQWILLLAFIGVLALEAYIGYTRLYSTVFFDPPVVPERGVVRVNLEAYNDAVRYLDGLNGYQPVPITLPRPEPFQ